MDSRALVRTRATPPQAGLDQKARKKNLRGAFTLCRPMNESHVALLDDVITTGSTVREISRVLKAAGVAKVEVWAVARTP
jgi:predicted amidophosphoribosyltransferase